MPIAIPPPLRAAITFSLPSSRLTSSDQTPEYYATVSGDSRPKEQILVPIHDLRPELEGGEEVMGTVLEQLESRGFAVERFESGVEADALGTEEGIARYLEETIDRIKTATGASKVIAWNSVCRRADVNVFVPKAERQSMPEMGFLPTKDVSPTAVLAHCDQDAFYGDRVCEMASNQTDLSTHYSRRQVINVWRPLRHTVTNSPLAVMDVRTLRWEGDEESGVEADVSVMANVFGFGYGVHHNPNQKWNYIQHQTPSEIIYIKCYDSFQGKDGIAKSCPHTACDVFGEKEFEGEVKPRESIEVRLVVLHE